jgi:hypothetical protein
VDCEGDGLRDDDIDEEEDVTERDGFAYDDVEEEEEEDVTEGTIPPCLSCRIITPVLFLFSEGCND